MDKQGDLIFALDIGTRTIIGLVIEHTSSSYKILSSEVLEHEERSMLDGQIHNVNKVVNQVVKLKRRLENNLHIQLDKVVIAAAGRALKTINIHNTIELDNKRIITRDDVQRLEFSAIQKAQYKLAAADPESSLSDYHFVGYSVIEYLLDGIYIGNLEGQKGKKMEINLIATFLPRIVVDSLLTVVDMANLKVDFLTLEPIAAANVVIPKDMFNFNLALVDIGAGTSDIALTKGGSMIGYAMVSVAGDEITETLAEYYMLDYYNGEKIKRDLNDSTKTEFKIRNILSQDVVIKRDEAIKVIESVVQSLALKISEAIMQLNRKAPQGVICIGGGSLTPNLTKEIAKCLEMVSNRIGIKKYEDIKNVFGEIHGINSTQAITPIGIAISSYQNKYKGNFIKLVVNDKDIQLFTINKPSVADALLAAGLDFKKLFGLPGMGLTCNVNGELKIMQGSIGKKGRVILNDEVVSLEKNVSNGDRIIFEPGQVGKDASGIIADVVPHIPAYHLKINDEPVTINSVIYQNGKIVGYTDPIIDGAEITYQNISSIKDGIAQLYEMSSDLLINKGICFTLNGKKKYIPQSELLILEKGRIVDIERSLEDDLNLYIVKRNDKLSTLKGFLFDEFKNNRLCITFNGSELTIELKDNLYCNGKRVGFDYEIRDGDQIVYKPSKVDVRYVLNYINFPISSFFSNFTIIINDHKATLKDQVKDGDSLQIVLNKD